jgi:hypothetical protein
MFSKNSQTTKNKFSISKNEITLLQNHGWKIISLDNLHIEHIDGSIASQNASLLILKELKSDYSAFENLQLIIADQLDTFESTTGNRIECILTKIDTQTQNKTSFYFEEDGFFPLNH